MSLPEENMKIQKKSNYVVIEFSGNLEYGKIEVMKKELQGDTFNMNTDYVIDMQKVNNIDSTGFGMIVNFAKKVAVRGPKITIIVVDEFIRNLFTISQCDKVFPIVRSEAEAEKMMTNGWQSEISINDY